MVALPAPSVQQSYHAPRVSRVPYFMVAGAAVIAIALVVFAVAFTSNDEKATSAAEASEQASTESTSGAGSDDERSAQEDSESPPAGTVRVRSEPAGAEIFINDDSWGKTPLDVELAPGKYVIRLEKTGYATAVRERDVTDKHTLEFDVQLAEASSGQESRVRSSSKRSRRGSRSERRTQTLEGSDGPVVRKQPDRVDPSVEPTRVDPDTKTSAKPKDKSSKTGSKGNPYKND
jgi:hypothetical protein